VAGRRRQAAGRRAEAGRRRRAAVDGPSVAAGWQLASSSFLHKKMKFVFDKAGNEWMSVLPAGVGGLGPLHH
jgi:hypothetical protein